MHYSNNQSCDFGLTLVPITTNKTQPNKDAPQGVQLNKDPPLPPPTKEVEKATYTFSLENEISKIKILVPFGEIFKVNEYRSKIFVLKSQLGPSYILNLQEDHSTISIGPRVEDE